MAEIAFSTMKFVSKRSLSKQKYFSKKIKPSEILDGFFVEYLIVINRGKYPTKMKKAEVQAQLEK